MTALYTYWYLQPHCVDIKWGLPVVGIGQLSGMTEEKRPPVETDVCGQNMPHMLQGSRGLIDCA